MKQLKTVSRAALAAALPHMEFKEAAPDQGEFKSAIDAVSKAVADFRAAHAEEIKGIEKKFDDVVTQDKLKRINDALDAAIEKKDALDKRLVEVEKKMGRPGGGDDKAEQAAELELKGFNTGIRSWTPQGMTPPTFDADAYAEYKAGFIGYLTKGRAIGLEGKDMTVVSDPDGGYLVPADMSGRIVVRMRETSPMRQYANLVSTTSDSLEGINDLDEAGAGWVGETETRSDTATPQVGKYAIPVHEMYAQPRASQKMLDDAAVDIEAWLAGKVTDRFSRLENAAFVGGSGVGRPRGFADYGTAATADASRAWGTLQHRLTGANGAFASSNPGDVFFDLVADLKPHFLPGAAFYTRRTIVAAIRKFKGATTGDYLWQPGLQAGQPQSILGYPVRLFEDMPALGAGSLSLAFGDMMQAYTIVDRVGQRVLRDPFTAKPFVRFYTTKRVGGGIVDFEALKFLNFSS